MNRSSIIASTSDGGADLEVGGDLGEVGVADDHVQPAVLLGVGVRLVAGVDDRPLERGLQPDLDLEVVGALADLEAVLAAVLADADPAGAADHLAADEERREVPDDVARTAWTGASGSSRGRRRTRPCCRCCSCRAGSAPRPGSAAANRDASSMTCSPALSHFTTSRGLVHSGRGVLRVRVVDVEPGAVGEDDVGQAEVLVGELGGVGDLAGHVEAAGVAQRRLLLEVPPGPPGPQRRRWRRR